ncbi:hypothetical protein Patl1_06975 [Pistacia atlantica]|uniref:Uncharacterized protein n=1 Tax=Pistacia atlantica TaxID=434234 RepID=A0ACC1AHQ7_9ROSI|nr:hypothetical protein Patl1_06975 [Pistacia atlantica]
MSPNYLIVADVLFPEDESDLGGIGCRSGKVEVLRKIMHKGVVKCARHMPQNTSYIATKTVSGEVHIFDHVKYPLEPTSDSVLSEQEGPELRLLGHRTNGYGFSHDKLSWSKLKKGYLLSGADDSQIFVWDINATPNNVALRSTRKVYGTFFFFFGFVHSNAESPWLCTHFYIYNVINAYQYGIFGNPATLSNLLWLTRMRSLLYLSIPFDERTLATGSADKMVNLYDLRNVNKARYTFTDHRIGTKQKFDQIFKGPPELLFVHIGHKSAIKEFSWDLNGDWDIASVAEDERPSNMEDHKSL